MSRKHDYSTGAKCWCGKEHSTLSGDEISQIWKSMLNRKYLTYQGIDLSARLDIEPAVTLEAAVNDQLRSILGTAPADWHGGEELPRPALDLTSYADAFASAAKNCEHENATDVLYGREWHCEDCGRYFDRAEWNRIRRKGGGFFRFF